MKRVSVRLAPYFAILSRSYSFVIPRYFPNVQRKLSCRRNSYSPCQNNNDISSYCWSMGSSSLASDYVIRIHPVNSHYDILERNTQTLEASDSLSAHFGELRWQLIPLDYWKPEITTRTSVDGCQSETIAALSALRDCAKVHFLLENNSLEHKPSATTLARSSWTIRCYWERANKNEWYISTNVLPDRATGCGEEKCGPIELVCILSRIMIQSAAFYIQQTNTAASSQDDLGPCLHLTLPTLTGGEVLQEVLLVDIVPCDSEDCVTHTFRCHGKGGHSHKDTNKDPHHGIRKLFAPLNPTFASLEIVDMVNHKGQVLGSLPRKYVHNWNILHRGVGVIISKDKSIIGENVFSGDNMPMIYVHQRANNKLIFPSLYDMFVGGISSRGERAHVSAAREVAEELGLKNALDFITTSNNHQKQNKKNASNLWNIGDHTLVNPLSELLFQCTVCTCYNRCIVSLFTYNCNTEVETVKWQEEEVAWGDFVPYEPVKKSAKFSRDRLLQNGLWPGSDVDNNCESSEELDTSLLHQNIEQLNIDNNNHPSSESWDYVPDGLLVWQSWLYWWHHKKMCNKRGSTIQ